MTLTTLLSIGTRDINRPGHRSSFTKLPQSRPSASLCRVDNNLAGLIYERSGSVVASVA